MKLPENDHLRLPEEILLRLEGVEYLSSLPSINVEVID